MQTRVLLVHFTAETSTGEHLLQIATVIIGEGLAEHPQGSPAVIEVQLSYRRTLDPEALVWQQLLLLLPALRPPCRPADMGRQESCYRENGTDSLLTVSN